MAYSKEAITTNLHGKFFEHSQTQRSTHAQHIYFAQHSKTLFLPSFTLNITLLGFSDTLVHILLTDAQNKSRLSTDAHKQFKAMVA